MFDKREEHYKKKRGESPAEIEPTEQELLKRIAKDIGYMAGILRIIVILTVIGLILGMCS